MNAAARTDPAEIAWSFWRQLGEGEIEAALALLADDGIYWVTPPTTAASARWPR